MVQRPKLTLADAPEKDKKPALEGAPQDARRAVPKRVANDSSKPFLLDATKKTQTPVSTEPPQNETKPIHTEAPPTPNVPPPKSAKTPRRAESIRESVQSTPFSAARSKRTDAGDVVSSPQPPVFSASTVVKALLAVGAAALAVFLIKRRLF